MNRNAIILAAGKSNTFAPFTYEKPKGLFKVRGDVLIERQIEQLREAGIKKIYIVVGYMKEKFFYLEKKYNVHLLINNKFNLKGNLYSLYMAREYLNNSFICCADHYFPQNIFIDDNKNNCSYRLCSFQNGKFSEFAVKCSDANIITRVEVGGENSLAMVGPAYMNDSFSSRFRQLMEKEIDDFGVSNLFWEEFYAKHIEELSFYKRECNLLDSLEFETIDDLRKFDSEFLLNVDSEIIQNICGVLHCNANSINNISVINAGLTNVSFSFEVDGKKYVYRHPGGTADKLIDRKSEYIAQKLARKYGIDKSVIHLDLSGWKLSYYVENAKNCSFEKDSLQLETAMKYLRTLHSAEKNSEMKVFDNVLEGKKLIYIASATKGHLEKEFAEIIQKVERLYEYIKMDAVKLGYSLVICHNDTYEPNFLYDASGQIFLIDWEYAGLNYAANDLGSILCRYDWSKEQINRYIRAFLGHAPSFEEKRFHYAFIPISGFYWFCWGLYKGSVGDDDSFFFLPSYRNIVRFIDDAIESYQEKE